MPIKIWISKAMLSSLIIGAITLVLMIFIVIGGWFFSSFGEKGMALISLAGALIVFKIARSFIMEHQELEKTQQKLKEAKEILEIKVKARTKELEEINAKLEEIVERRTRELKNQIEELEKFHRAVVGRELKMIELKQEIKKLKEELEACKNRQFLDLPK